MAFWNGKQRADVTLPASKAVLTVLMEQWPRAMAADELCRIALERAASLLETSVEEARRTTMPDLFGGVMHGMIDLHRRPPLCTNSPCVTPHAHPVAAHQAATGDVVVNAHHEMFQLEPLGIEVLRLANGERRRTEILDALAGTDHGEPLTAERLDRTLKSLTRCAVLME